MHTNTNTNPHNKPKPDTNHIADFNTYDHTLPDSYNGDEHDRPG
jgi:hypothetical protein